MKKKERIIIYLLIFFSICLGVYSTIVNERVEADWMGVLVGCLSLLVTVLVGLNIFSLVDFNAKSKNIGKQIDTLSTRTSKNIRKLNEKYKDVIRKTEILNAEMSYYGIFNYAHLMYERNFTQYAMDGYIDALNVAIHGNLSLDKKQAAIDGISNIISEYKEMHNHVPILPGKRTCYYDIISNFNPKTDITRNIGIYILNEALEENMSLPPGNIRVMSDNNPDNKI